MLPSGTVLLAVLPGHVLLRLAGGIALVWFFYATVRARLSSALLLLLLGLVLLVGSIVLLLQQLRLPQEFQGGADEGSAFLPCLFAVMLLSAGIDALVQHHRLRWF